MRATPSMRTRIVFRSLSLRNLASTSSVVGAVDWNLCPMGPRQFQRLSHGNSPSLPVGRFSRFRDTPRRIPASLNFSFRLDVRALSLPFTQVFRNWIRFCPLRFSYPSSPFRPSFCPWLYFLVRRSDISQRGNWFILYSSQKGAEYLLFGVFCPRKGNRGYTSRW